MVRAQGAALVFAAFVLGGLSSACGALGDSTGSTSHHASATAMDTTDSAEIRDVHAIYKSRCGSCHVRIEPGSHTRTQLETAFSHHRTRVRMNDAEWSNMVNFLASDSSNNAQASAVSTSK